MSELLKARANTPVHEVPASGPSPQTVVSTYLSPADPFPTTLAELELVDLHVLHSRITRQLDREYIDPAGPHPVTVDRAQELVAELDTRQDFLAPTDPGGPAAALPAHAPCAFQDAEAAPLEAAGESAPASPCQDGQHPGALSPVTEQEPGEAGVPIDDLARLRPGQRIQLWHRGQVQCVGTVEEAAPALGVVWIREALDGYRRMIHTQDTELRYHRSRHGRGDDR
jgi:hypothetical protein